MILHITLHGEASEYKIAEDYIEYTKEILSSIQEHGMHDNQMVKFYFDINGDIYNSLIRYSTIEAISWKIKSE